MSAEQLFSHYPAIPPPQRIELITLPRHACPYLPDRIAQYRGLLADQMSPEEYQAYMDAGFRRSGRVIYQPICGGCRECVPLRVSVARFAANKSQRRCQRRNADLRVEIAAPAFDEESFRLFARYLHSWHGRHDAPGRDEFEEFLIDSPVRTLQFRYRTPDGALVAVGICDVAPLSLSSVYFYFDPALRRRSLGTFGALSEIHEAAGRGIPHYYLGYWVATCRKMSYKCSYRPSQLLGSDGRWSEADILEAPRPTHIW
jgi:leucyl-tRNA---protein transferase